MYFKLIIVCITFFTFQSFAQELTMPEMADSVQNFIETNGHNMDEYVESCETFDSCQDMNYHTKTYTFKGNAQFAFDQLIAMGPLQIWQRSSRFEMEYDPETKQLLGKHQKLPPIQVGQIFFLELDIIKQMQIPVAFKVVELDTNIRTVTFSYLKQNKSNGSQRITFYQDGEKIKIVHETHFRSDSNFRDKHLYRFFHTRLLDDVWEDFAKKLSLNEY